MSIFCLRLATAISILLICFASIFAQNSGFDLTRMDNSTEACTDFFQYANGTWIKDTEIPAAYSRWGTFNILAENNRDILKEILDETSKLKGEKGSDAQLIGDFYTSCNDESAIEAAGISPLKPYFNQISKIRNTEDLVRQIALMHNASVPSIFGFGGGTDIKNSSMVIANTGQGGLSLPNRDYYLNGDVKSQEIRQKFREYMMNMFKLLGDSETEARSNAQVVQQIQTRLAYASKAPVELRNPENRYNKMSLDAAKQITPNFDWDLYMQIRGVPPITEINIGQPDFFKEVNSMLKEVPIREWKIYLRWMMINDAAPALSKSFEVANFDFYSKYLSGTKEQQPRWRRCVAATDGNLGEALGQEYVKKAFQPEAKARMDELISNLFVAMKDRIDGLEWMSDTTKTEAQKKLSTFKRKIGYPDILRGYKGLDVSRNSYFQNSLKSAEFQIKRNLEDIGKPTDRTRWGMTPPTVNAYYNPVLNEIVFPAGILQPPFFNFQADDAINYGAIGGVIGHEISHGFDDQGSKFDAEGNNKSWWTPEDRSRFEERTACVVKQFDEYEVQPNIFMNGKLTLGENIGDLGGLLVAYTAFQNSLEGKPRPQEIDGFTAEQRFFLGWAQVWAGKSTTEAEALQVKTDPHALARWRVNGPLSNMPQFAAAFNCGQGQKMVKKDFCQIW